MNHQSQILALGLILLAGCRHVTTIRTDPPGARVFLDGKPIGESPIRYSYWSGTPKTFLLKIEKFAHEPLLAHIDSGWRADHTLWLLMPGILPFFFTARLEDSYHYRLKARKAGP